MKIILLSDFKKIQSKNYVYSFLNAESCKLCETFIEDISHKIDKDKWTFVLCRDEDEEWIFKHLSIANVPQTFVYKDNDLIYKVGGKLFDTQLKYIKRTVKEFFSEK